MKHQKQSLCSKSRATKGFTLIELMIVVTILSILASAAIPAFIKYVRRAKTTEAVLNLRKLFDGSVVYYNAGYSDRFGRGIEPRFPGLGEYAVGPVPGTNPCCGLTGDKCPPAGSPTAPQDWTARWNADMWQALNFSINEYHYYWYEYETKGVGPGLESGARFTARAMGNLNCNDSYSTFERVGGVSNENEVIGGAAVYRINPLE